MYHYQMCGLPNVWLENGYEIHETEYGEAVSFHDIQGLHKAIGQAIIHNESMLNAAEIKFLRGNMRLSQVQLANLLGVSDSSIRAWENQRTEIPAPADRLLRALYNEQAFGDGGVKQMIEAINLLARNAHQEKINLIEENGHWREVQVA
jgi:hypothetical protein